MVKYQMERMSDSFQRAKIVAEEISVRALKVDVRNAVDDDLNQINIYAQFAGELRELIRRYEDDLDEFAKPASVARAAISRAVNDVLNGLALKATMRSGKGGA